MGAGLNRAAYHAGAALDHAAMRLYGYMATRALDSDPTPKFWGGREALAAALGKEADNAGFKAARSALGKLRDAGLIRDGRTAHTGRHATYLLLNGHGAPLRPPAEEAHPERAALPERGARSGAKRRTLSGQEAHPQRAPEEEERNEEEGAPPPRYCSKHPEGTDNPCRPCKRAREAREAWEAAEAAKPRPPRPHVHRPANDGTCLGGDDCTDVQHPDTGQWVPRNDPSLPEVGR